MKLRIDPVTLTILAIIATWGLYEVTTEDTCEIARPAIENGVEVQVIDVYPQEYCDTLN